MFQWVSAQVSSHEKTWTEVRLVLRITKTGRAADGAGGGVLTVQIPRAALLLVMQFSPNDENLGKVPNKVITFFPWLIHYCIYGNFSANSMQTKHSFRQLYTDFSSTRMPRGTFESCVTYSTIPHCVRLSSYDLAPNTKCRWNISPLPQRNICPWISKTSIRAWYHPPWGSLSCPGEAFLSNLSQVEFQSGPQASQVLVCKHLLPGTQSNTKGSLQM